MASFLAKHKWFDYALAVFIVLFFLVVVILFLTSPPPVDPTITGI